MDTMASDIYNAYFQAPSSEIYYIILCGIEFGLENVGKRAFICRAPYVEKSAGRNFRNCLREYINHIEFTSCPVDLNIWMRPARKSNGSEYWENVFLYTDDILVVISQQEKLLHEHLGKYFEIWSFTLGGNYVK